MREENFACLLGNQYGSCLWCISYIYIVYYTVHALKCCGVLYYIFQVYMGSGVSFMVWHLM